MLERNDIRAIYSFHQLVVPHADTSEYKISVIWLFL